VPLNKRVPWNEGVKERFLPYKIFILQLLTCLDSGTDMLLIITSTGDELFRVIYLDDLKRP